MILKRRPGLSSLAPAVGISAMETSHNARITLAGKEQHQKERFSFQPPIPIPLNGSSAMKTSRNAPIILDGKDKPLEKRFSFQSPIPLPSEAKIKSAYRFTMPPETQSIADTTFRINSELGLVNGPQSKTTWPNSCLLASQNSSDIKSCVFSNLWSEDQDERRVRSNVPFLGSLELPQRLGTIRPVRHRILAKRRSELKDRDGEPLSKRFRFQPAIPLCLGGSLAMESVGEDDTEAGEGPKGTKESGTDEKVMDLEKLTEKPLVDPFVDPFQDEIGAEVHGGMAYSPIGLRSGDSKIGSPVILTKRCAQMHQPQLEMIEKEGSRSGTDPGAPIKMISENGWTLQPPGKSVFLVRPRLRSVLPISACTKFTVDHTPKTRSQNKSSKDHPTHSESEQPRTSRTAKCKSSGRNDINCGQTRKPRPRRHPASTKPDATSSERSS